VIFLIGSVLAGLSQTISELIIFRAIQGIGGGGLMVGAQTIIGDIVPPRDRGRYQGFFGAVFGVASVLGPLIGGFFVDTLSWRWVFYVNVPVGIIGLMVVAAVLPGRRGREQHKVDYLGTIMIGAAATSLVLLTSLGGVTFPWGSAPIVTLAVLAVVFTACFVLAERRAAEPVLPLHLFTQRVFTAASAIGFVVGFAMFGALTYLPQYLQIVQGVSPTVSGLRLLPLMAGLLTTSVGTGQLISRWGRYKVFPVVGTATLIVGLYLLSHLGPSTGTALASLYMFVFGVGIGATMQVLVIAVQNAIDYADLGAGTSGVTFFRSIGGSFGTAVFGAIFDHVLPGNVASALHGLALPPGVSVTSGATPAALASQLVAASGIAVSPRSGWLLLRLGEHHGDSRAALAGRLSISPEELGDRMTELVRAGYVVPAATPDDADELTESGRSAYARIFAASQDRIALPLDGWQPQQHPRLLQLLTEITHELARHERPGPDLEPAR
jgi:EmrB/QacA subfamily drug resistance transporter